MQNSIIYFIYQHKVTWKYTFFYLCRYRTEYVTFRDILSHRTGTLPEAIGIFFGAINEASELV
jgi:hypothetical protein